MCAASVSTTKRSTQSLSASFSISGTKVRSVDQRAVFRMVDDPGDLLGKQPRIDGVVDRADAENAVPRLEVAPGVPGERRHPFARAGCRRGRAACATRSARLRIARNWSNKSALRPSAKRRSRWDAHAPHDQSADGTPAASPASVQALNRPLRICLPGWAPGTCAPLRLPFGIQRRLRAGVIFKLTPNGKQSPDLDHR